MADPLSTLTDLQLQQTSLALQLACGRSHGAARKKKQQWYCFLNQALAVEAAARGVALPSAPFHAGDLKPFAL